MINLPQDFKRYEKTITNFCHDRIEGYFSHERAYRALKRKIGLLDDIIDLRFKNNEAFIAEVAVPIVRKRYKELRAFTRKYLEQDPLITIQAVEAPEDNARYLQSILNKNFYSTKFRDKCLTWAIDNGSRYGVYVIYTQYCEGYGAGGYETVYEPNGLSAYPHKRKEPTRYQNSINYAIHPLNYFQDPQANYAYDAQWRGFIDTWTIADLGKCLQYGDYYIKENVEKVLKHCKGSGSKDQYWYGGNGVAEAKDFTRGVVNVRRLWTTLPFDGNEFDTRTYYIEMIDNVIIRIHENDIDHNTVPLSVGTYFSRQDVWWGNTDIEELIPYQNLQNWLINTSVESTMKLMDRFILLRRGNGINWADVNNRHQMGGIVPYDGIENPAELVHPVQFQDRSLDHLDWLGREIKQYVQESSPVVNLQNKYNQGGLNNSTLGAAQMAAGIGDILQADSMETFAAGIKYTGEVNARILQQMLGDHIAVKRAPNMPEEIIPKHKILGNFGYAIESSLKTSDIVEFTKRTNQITQLLNWMGTGHPAFQGVNIGEFLKRWIASSNGQWSDTERFYQEAPAALPQLPQGNGAPSSPAQQAPQSAMPLGTSPAVQQMQTQIQG